MAPTREVTNRHRLEYALVRAFAGGLRAMPMPLAAFAGRRVTGLLHALDKRHRLRVREQLQMALGVDEAEAVRLARAVYDHIGTLIAEMTRVPSLTVRTLDRIVDWESAGETYEMLRQGGRGYVLATGHIGNWEVAGPAFAAKQFSAGAVARPLDNPLLNDYVRRLRESTGQTIWDKFGALRKIVRLLREGQSCALLVDQDAGKRGLFVPFFGMEASTIPTVADLALHTGAPILTGALLRTDGPMRFRFVARPPVYPDLSAPEDEERLRLLRIVNEHLESIIREAPEQWLWLHRRWKTRPRTEQPDAAALAVGGATWPGKASV